VRKGKEVYEATRRSTFELHSRVIV